MSSTSKKIDSRVKILLENNKVKKYRSIFAICGEKPHFLVPVLFNFLLKPKATVLWCYKKNLDHRDKKNKNNKKKRKPNPEEDPFEMFTRSTSIRWCYYHETDRILGNSYDLLVIQDFEALTPNVLARTIETVNGGGLIIFLLKSMESIECLCMDVHRRYQTEAHKDVVSRFNQRFILALQQCQSFIAIDTLFNPLHLPSQITEYEPKQESSNLQLTKFKNSLKEKSWIGKLVDLCKTLDQSQAVVSMLDSLVDKVLRTTVSLTAARGRGKSAALGLAVAGAIEYKYCNIFVSSPSPENLKTFFDFVVKGLEALNYVRNCSYEVINSTEPSHNKAVVRVNVFGEYNQTIQYVSPKSLAENSLLKKSAELVVIDEAAAIPLPIIKTFLGPYLVFLSSTIDGYEGTGRALSLKLIEQLRYESKYPTYRDSTNLREITLQESIRYGDGDEAETWLNDLLCLKINDEKVNIKKKSDFNNLDECKLFFISRDVLFSYHPTSEQFLKKLMALYVASHYKNSPNDLQMMADAPAHHLFCLLGSKDGIKRSAKDKESSKALPEVLCFIQVCLEGQISAISLTDGLKQNKRAAGDLIPWTLAQQFQDNKFPSLSGARVVRIATNPDYMGHGFGKKALSTLFDYYEGKFLDENDSSAMDDDAEQLTNESKALLISLDERRPERLDYVGVCYGVTNDLYCFWKSSGFVPVYIRQTPNELTGENSCIMIKFLHHRRPEFCLTVSNDWLVDFWIDFRRRFVSLLDRVFRKLSIHLAYEIITSDKNLQTIKNKSYVNEAGEIVTPYCEKNGLLSNKEIDMIFSDDDFNRCSSFFLNESVSPQGILDCLPVLTYFYFTQRCTSFIELDKEVCYILIALGLQRKSFSEISKELLIDYDTILSNLRKGLKILSSSLMKIKHNQA